MKVLNLYAEIGGNRKLWEGVEVTALEHNPQIANVYRQLFPQDNVIVTDAHQYLIDHFKEYDFIWASPPCPSHSCIRKMGCNPRSFEEEGQNKPIYPDMKLYQEIILLQHYFKGKWIVENVMPYYEPLIKAKKLDRHLFWSNYPLNEKKFNLTRKHNLTMDKWKEELGIDLTKYDISADLYRVVYRNCVDSNVGKYVFDMAYTKKQQTVEAFF